jgi:hypothetical protein
MKGLTELTDFLERKWFEKSGLLAAIVVCSVGSMTLFTSQADSAWIRLLSAVSAGLLVYGVWLVSRRIPKTKQGKVGIVVAVSCENDAESQRLRADFIDPLRKAIHSGFSGGSLQLIELPHFLLNSPLDNESALTIKSKVRAHLMLYGRVRRRVDGKDEFCYLELDGIVSHRPVSNEISKAFGKEFSELLPRGIRIPAGREFAGFSITSNLTEIVAKYVLGIAAGLSGDLAYAETLFSEVHSRVHAKLAQDKEDLPTYRTLSKRIPFRLLEIYEARAIIAYSDWRKNPSAESLDVIEESLKAMVRLGISRPPSFYFFSAIHHFLLNRDVSSALEELKNVKGQGGIWNLNVAFLNAYKGNLRAASRHYKLAAATEVDLDTSLQVEDFLCRILEIEPDKYQVNFCLGMFNEHIKGDLNRAVYDYEAFLTSGNPSDFAIERELVKNWISALKASI